MALRRAALRLQQPRVSSPGAGAFAVPEYKKSAATDLTRTRVHRGLGTSKDDPVNRVMPNQITRAPEPTVLTHRVDGHAKIASFTDGSARVDVDIASKAQLTFAEWFGTGPDGCALGSYVAAMKSRDALPLSRRSKAILREFEEKQFGAFVQEFNLGDESMARKQWAQATAKFTETTHLFDRAAFDAHLDKCTQGLLNFFSRGSNASPDELSHVTSVVEGVADILRRDAVLKRNAALDEVIAAVNSPALEGGQAVWNRFFAHVEALRERLIDEDDSVRARYELAALETLPAVKASVALLFVHVTSAFANASTDNGTADKAAAEAAARAASLHDNLHHLSRDDVIRFAAPHLRSILREPRLEAFARLGLGDVTRDLAANNAAQHTARAKRREMAAEIVGLFGSMDSAESVLARVASAAESGTQAEVETARMAKQQLYTTMRTSKLADGSQVKAAMEAVGWKKNYRALAMELLSNPDFVVTLHAALKASLQTSDKYRAVAGELVTEGTMKYLEQMIDKERDVLAAVDESIDQHQLGLLRDCPTPKLVRLLEVHGVDVQPLRDIVASRIEAVLSEKVLPASTFRAVVEEVAKRHPKWAQLGIVDPARDGALEPSSAPALRLLLHVYLRKSYVPSSGAALLAQRHRNRIGPIATEPDQTNLEVEVGFAEQYDAQEYKKYDWQGWYQRIIDVKNRNVALRCKLSNMRVIENHTGRPFVDLQTERRLRIVAGERVANGVLKLDSDRFEDQKDNLEFGTVKMQDVLSEAKKAQLGEEYWPSVEVKVQRPAGQSKMLYSMLDWQRVEDESKTAFEKYKAEKKTAIFVPPSKTWLKVSGVASVTKKQQADAEGYTVDSLFESMDGDQKQDQ